MEDIFTDDFDVIGSPAAFGVCSKGEGPFKMDLPETRECIQGL